MLDQLLKNIINDPAFTTLVVSSIAAVVAFFGKKLNTLLNRKLSAQELKLLLDIAARCVLAAEQLATTNEEKKTKALAAAQEFLTAYGLKVSAIQLDAAIEAAVLSELTKLPPLEPAT